jgi:hypothetical protein
MPRSSANRDRKPPKQPHQQRGARHEPRSEWSLIAERLRANNQPPLGPHSLPGMDQLSENHVSRKVKQVSKQAGEGYLASGLAVTAPAPMYLPSHAPRPGPRSSAKPGRKPSNQPRQDKQRTTTETDEPRFTLDGLTPSDVASLSAIKMPSLNHRRLDGEDDRPRFRQSKPSTALSLDRPRVGPHVDHTARKSMLGFDEYAYAYADLDTHEPLNHRRLDSEDDQLRFRRSKPNAVPSGDRSLKRAYPRPYDADVVDADVVYDSVEELERQITKRHRVTEAASEGPRNLFDQERQDHSIQDDRPSSSHRPTTDKSASVVPNNLFDQERQDHSIQDDRPSSSHRPTTNKSASVTPTVIYQGETVTVVDQGDTITVIDQRDTNDSDGSGGLDPRSPSIRPAQKRSYDQLDNRRERRTIHSHGGQGQSDEIVAQDNLLVVIFQATEGATRGRVAFQIQRTHSPKAPRK